MSRHRAGRDDRGGAPVDPERLRRELRTQAREAVSPGIDRLGAVRRKRARVRRTRGVVGVAAAVVATGLVVGVPRLAGEGTSPVPVSPASSGSVSPTPTPSPTGRWQKLPPMVMLHAGRYYHQAEGARLSALFPGGENRTMKLHAQPYYRLALAGTLTAPPEAQVSILIDGRTVRTIRGSGLVLLDLRRHPGWQQIQVRVGGRLAKGESLAIRAYRDLPEPSEKELAMAIPR